MDKVDPNKLKLVKFPMNSSKVNMKDKKCDYKTLAIVTLYSNMTPIKKQEETGTYEIYRYIYRNKLIANKEAIEELSNRKIDTILKNVTKLSKLNSGIIKAYKTREDKIYYSICYTNHKDREFVTIEGEMLMFLINSGNSNIIKTYILLKYRCNNDKNEVRISLKNIAENIGLSPKSNSNLNVITDILDNLENNGFINRDYNYTYDNNDIKCCIYYSVNNYDVWKSICRNKRNNNRRKVN